MKDEVSEIGNKGRYVQCSWKYTMFSKRKKLESFSQLENFCTKTKLGT